MGIQRLAELTTPKIKMIQNAMGGKTVIQRSQVIEPDNLLGDGAEENVSYD